MNAFQLQEVPIRKWMSDTCPPAVVASAALARAMAHMLANRSHCMQRKCLANLCFNLFTTAFTHIIRWVCMNGMKSDFSIIWRYTHRISPFPRATGKSIQLDYRTYESIYICSTAILAGQRANLCWSASHNMRQTNTKSRTGAHTAEHWTSAQLKCELICSCSGVRAPIEHQSIISITCGARHIGAQLRRFSFASIGDRTDNCVKFVGRFVANKATKQIYIDQHVFN